jgi:hypothetical protein
MRIALLIAIAILQWSLFSPHPNQDQAAWFWQALAAFADRQAETTVHRGAPGPAEHGDGILAGWKNNAATAMAKTASKEKPVPNYAGGSHWLQLSLKFFPMHLGRWRHLLILRQLNADYPGAARTLTLAMQYFPNNAYLLLDRTTIFGDLVDYEIRYNWAKEAYTAMLSLPEKEKQNMGLLELRNFHLQLIKNIIQPSREQKRNLNEEEVESIRSIYSHLLKYDPNLPSRSLLFQELHELATQHGTSSDGTSYKKH